MISIRYLVFFICIFIAHLSNAAGSMPPEQAPKLSEIAVVALRKLNGDHLDYSPESLRIIDRLFLKFRSEGYTPESMNKFMFVVGCYTGEVIVRNNPGSIWDMPTENEIAIGFTSIGVRSKNGTFSNPIDKVYKLMQSGEEDSLMSFYNEFLKSSKIVNNILDDKNIMK